MKYLKNYKDFNISDNLKYHVDSNITLSENLFRYGSDAYLDLINEARELWKNGVLDLDDNDRLIVEKLQTGKKAIYKGEEVKLDLPFRITEKDRKKKFRVYRDSGKKDKETGLPIAKKIDWGDPNLSVKNFDDKRRKSFLARHKCNTKTDMDTAGWWSCNPHLFWKQLGLSSNKPW